MPYGKPMQYKKKASKPNLPDLSKAKEFVKAGGKLESIKNKYQLTDVQEKELTTL